MQELKKEFNFIPNTELSCILVYDWDGATFMGLPLKCNGRSTNYKIPQRQDYVNITLKQEKWHSLEVEWNGNKHFQMIQSTKH